MRRLPLVLAIVLPLQGQQAPDPQTQPPAAAEVPSPVPSSESWLTGSIDLGYRWRTDVGGSFDTYRSIVNLGSGPKLMGTDFTLTDPRHRAFDQIRVRANGWGEPYQAFHLDAKKSNLYDFRADYRDIAYFNFLPSYADPLLSRGIVLNEQSFDTRRHMGSFQLDLLPGNWFIPYVAYDRNSGAGTGATTFVANGNEYPVPSTLRDQTSLYRGGARFELRRFHATFEQGGTMFKDDQQVFQSPGSTNFGNVTTTLFGQRTNLTSLAAAYGIRGNSIYSKALFSAEAAPWLDLYGQFLFSQPDTDVHYQQSDTGNNLFFQNQLPFYTSQQYLVTAAAKLPHTSGSFGAEIHPFQRVRIVQSWITDRLHNAGSAASTQKFAGASVSQQTAALLASSLATNYSQEEIDIFFEATSKLTLRGGYRYVWGDANYVVLPPAGLMSSDQAKLRRNTGIGGVTYRPNQKISIRADAEVASSGGAYFRTSLYDYQKVHAQARYQAWTSLSLTADFTMLNNQNPVPGVNYDYRSQQESLSLFWSPAGGKILDFQGSYTRSTLHSEIGYLIPQTLQPQASLYRDNAHTATALFNVNFPQSARIAPKLTAGGSFFISSGSRATNYYQPLATLWLPIGKKTSWFADWRYYGYGEASYFYEGFRTNLVTTGLRFTR